MKQFLSSKINITALIVVLIAIQDFISNYDVKQLTNPKAWALFILGLLIIIFRTWFTAATPKQ